MEPQALFRTLRRRWRPLAVLAVLGAALGVASAAVAEDAGPVSAPVVRYDACHTLLVDDAIPTDVPQWDVRNLPQLAERITQGAVPAAVAADTGLDLATVSNAVRVGVRNDVRSLTICAVGTTPAGAEELADTFAAELIAELGGDAAQFHEASLTAAAQRILDAEACVAEAQRGQVSVTEGDDTVTTADAAAQEVSLCELQLIDARTTEINLRSSGVPVVPLKTLEAGSAVEISDRDYAARVREGAAGANVVLSSSPFTVGASAPTATGSTTSPIPSSPPLRGLLGLCVGLAIGLSWVQFTERLDSRLRRKDDVEETLDLPVLAEIPPLSRAERKSNRIVSVEEPRSRSAESFRALRSALDYAHAVDVEAGRSRPGAQVVLVTSGSPSEGKTTTIANLATVMAEGDRRVLAVNCDFRRPRLHRYLGGTTTPQRLNVTDIPGVQLVTQVTPDDAAATPSDVVAAQRRLVERAREHFDVILLDTAPILTTNDAAELLPVADQVVVVVRSGTTKAEAAARASELLERRGRPPLGVALVGTRDVPNSSDYYYADDDPYLVSSHKHRRRRRTRDDAAVDAENESSPAAEDPVPEQVG